MIDIFFSFQDYITRTPFLKLENVKVEMNEHGHCCIVIFIFTFINSTVKRQLLVILQFIHLKFIQGFPL